MEFKDKVLQLNEMIASSLPMEKQTMRDWKYSLINSRPNSQPNPTSHQRNRFKTQQQALSFYENQNQYTYQRPDSASIQSQIGPGAYKVQNPAHLQQNCPQISFTKGQRYIKKLNNPGPGDYNIFSERQSKTFVFNSRNSKNFDQQTPGPGTYDLSQSSQRSISFGTARKMSQDYGKFTTPGPGAYLNNKVDINKEVQKEKNYRIERLERIERIKRLVKSKRIATPYYNRKEDKVVQEICKQQALQQKSQRPKSAIQLKQEGRRRKMEKLRKSSNFKSDPPGPGSYEIKDFIKIDKVDKKCAFKQKQFSTERPKGNEELGPGRYDIKDFLSQIEYIKRGNQQSVFNKSRRFQKEEISDLGPGYYDIIDDQY